MANEPSGPKSQEEAEQIVAAATAKQKAEQEAQQAREREQQYEIQSLKRAQDRLNIRKEEAEANTNAAEKAKELADIALEQLRIDSEKLLVNDQLNHAQKEHIKNEFEQLKNNQKLANLELDISKSLTNQVQSLTGITGKANTFLGQMTQLAFNGGSLTTVFSSVLDNLKQTITVANVLSAAVDKIVQNTIELAKEQDKAYADFEREAGNVRKYEDSIMSLRRSNGLYGISVTDAAKQFSQFKQQFAGFESMSSQQQITLATTAGQLEKLGIATGDVIKTQDILVKAMGMTAQQSTDLQKSLYGTAKAMEIPPKQMASDFAKAAPQLAAHGKNMTKVFLDLQNNAKNTGIEFNRLLAITGQFDTFEGAADAAGKLNAILGGDYLNSIELLNAEEGERVKILQESLKASGRSIETMSKQEQRAAAQALGLQDVTELQKLMNNETTKGTVEAMRAEEAQKNMNAAVEDAQELGQMFNNLLAKAAFNLRPVIELLKSATAAIISFFDTIGKGWDSFKGFIGGFEKLSAFAGGVKDVLSKIDTALGGIPGKILAVITVLGGLYLAWRLLKFAVTSMIKGVAKTFAETLQTMEGPIASATKNIGEAIGEGVESASEGISSAIENIGSAVSKNKIAMLTAAVALLAISVSLYITAKAVQEFASVGWEDMKKAGIALLGLVMTLVIINALKGQLLMGAAALGIMGLSLIAVAYAFNMFNDVDFLQLAAGGLAIGLFALAIAGLGFLFTGPIGLAFLAGVGILMALGLAFMVVGSGMKTLGEGLSSLGKGFDDLFKIIKSIGDMENNISIMMKFLDDLTDIDVDPINELAKSMTLLAASMKLVGEAYTKIKGITAPTKAPEVSANVGSTTAASVATVAANAGGGVTNAGGSNIVPVAIYIDSKKVGEMLDPRYKKMIEDSLKNIDAKTVPV